MSITTKLTTVDKERIGILKRLSVREWEVVHLALKGHSNRDIANELFISLKTVEFHLRNIFIKLEVNKRVELINFFFSPEPMDWRKN